jgi:large subunit ribosomal protein L23
MSTLTDKIIRPILTEKSLDLAKNGRYTFEVDLKANKDQIKKALNDNLKVKVKSIKTAIQKDASRLVPKSRRQVAGRVWKKAIVEISEGKITMFEIVGEDNNDKKS